jgi:COMPASS component SWD3
VSGSVKKTYQGHANSGFSIGGCFAVITASPDDDEATDGRRRTKAFIASASEEGDIIFWDVTSKEIVQRIKHAHDGVCFWVDVNGDTMVSAGKDGTIKVFRNRRAVKSRAEDKINGVADALNGTAEMSHSPDAAAADEELQRHVEAGATSPLQQQQQQLVKVEDE